MTAKTILREIKPLGNLSYKKVLVNHGVAEPEENMNPASRSFILQVMRIILLRRVSFGTDPKG